MARSSLTRVVKYCECQFHLGKSLKLWHTVERSLPKRSLCWDASRETSIQNCLVGSKLLPNLKKPSTECAVSMSLQDSPFGGAMRWHNHKCDDGDSARKMASLLYLPRLPAISLDFLLPPRLSAASYDYLLPPTTTP